MAPQEQYIEIEVSTFIRPGGNPGVTRCSSFPSVTVKIILLTSLLLKNKNTIISLGLVRSFAMRHAHTG